jgi:hypothetical protein
MYKRIGVDVILRAERRGRKNQCRRLYLIPPRGSAPWSKSFFFFFFLNISVDRPKSLTGITAVIFVIQAGQFVALE